MRATALSLIALVAVPLFAAVELQPVVSGLDLPVAITHAGDSRLFITLQRGRIVIWDGTRILPDPFLDIRSRVFCGNSGSCGERGLLSVAFHPRYAENGRFFVYYTDLQGDIVIARYNVSADRDRADPSSAAIILEIPHQQFSNHNGGQLQFGPDGFLYAGTGDGGSGGDPFNNAQNLSSLLGKLLRIDVDGAAYTVPPSNPFAGGGGRGEIWAYGLRNPWRFTFDRANGDLWIADVGQGDWEEIDFQPASSRGGENYGWRRMEGTHCFNPSTNCAEASLTLPVIEYDHSAGACSVTGGFRYRGQRNPRLHGMYIYGDYCNGVISGATLRTDGTWASQQLVRSNVFISSFGEDLNGELYIAAHGGAIFRLIDTTPPLPKRRAVRR